MSTPVFAKVFTSQLLLPEAPDVRHVSHDMCLTGRLAGNKENGGYIGIAFPSSLTLYTLDPKSLKTLNPIYSLSSLTL